MWRARACRSNAFNSRASEGQQLAAALDLPEREPLAYALFAHCFTCGKDVLAARRIAVGARRQGHRGAAVRFHRARLQRRRVRQLDFLLQRRRPRARRRSSARNPQGAGDPDRPQPRRRRGAGGRRPNSGSQGRRHHRRALRSRPCHAYVRGSHRRHPRAGRGRSLARGPPVPHQARIPRRHRRAQSDGACRKAAQGAAGHALADRRHRRHRKCDPDLRRGQAPQELCVAGGRRSSAEPQERCGLCRRRHRGLGDALSRPGRAGAAADPAKRRATSWCAKPATASSSRRLRRAASSARRRAGRGRRRRHRTRAL